jgi:Zn-dependent protease
MTEDYNGEKNNPSENEDNAAPIDETPYQKILSEIDNQQNRQKSWVKNISIFAISLLVFFQLGLFSNGFQSVVNLVLVLLVHETGHLLGMRLFGYHNMQMLFIPFFGAAVSGDSRNVATYKKAIVSLLGPLPGVIIGCVLLLMYSATGLQTYWNLAVMFLFINVFNLLPFYPLDGGRFLYLTIFSRNRYLELLFRIFAALALIGIGIALNSWMLALLGLFNLLGLRIFFKQAKISKEVRQSEQFQNSPGNLTQDNNDAETIPEHKAKIIIDKIYEYFPPPINISTVAGYTKQIWENVSIRPSGIFSTTTLFLVYIMGFCLPVVALIGGMIVSTIERKGFVDAKIVEYQNQNGSKRLKEQIYLGSKLHSEIEVDPNNFLYDGNEVTYGDANSIIYASRWSQGMRNGTSEAYNNKGELIRVTVYDKGNFVSRKVSSNGQWQEKNWDDLSFYIKWHIKRDLKEPRGPTSRNIAK